MEMLHEQLVNLLALVLSGVLAWIGSGVTSLLKKKSVVTELESHKQLVEMVVNGVEQAYKTLGGKEKLDMAKIEILKLAKSKGIDISEGDLDMFIESAVKSMNGVVKEVEDVAETPAKIEAQS